MRRRGSIHDERGVVTVLVALSMLVMLLFAVLAVDAGNWFLHKRHLQIQADAAALAGAGVYTFPSCDNALITDTALRYSGKGDGTTTYNPPDDVKTDQADLFARINEPDFEDQPGNPGENDLPATPCDAKFVDVKMTETDVPWFFGSGIVDFINADARVALFQVETGEGLLPLGVQEAAPRKVRAYVVDEATGATLLKPDGTPASVLLDAHGSSGGLLQFNNDAAPLTVSLPAGTSPNVGVRVALSGSDTSTACGEPLVNCYDSVNTTRGISYIRTWAAGDDPTTGQAPVARSVTLTPGTCANASFTTSASACTMDVTAIVKWNPSVTATQIAANLARLTVTYNGTDYPMTYNPGTTLWTAAGINIPAGTIGPRNIALTWSQHTGTIAGDTCSTSGGNKCKGTFGDVQRTFWNNADIQGSQGGPIATLDVLDSNSLSLVTSLERCATCTASLIFQVGIKGALKLDLASDPPRSMRVSGSGSQNQTLDCDPGRGFVDEIAFGCQPPYAINKGTACSAPTTPVSCVPVQTGTTANKPAQGFNVRFLCAPPGNPGGCKGSAGAWDGKPDTCPPAGEYGHNNWPNYPPGDPRLVSVFLVPFGTFEASGNQLVPIIDFAAFYVTGYASQGQGFDNPCIGNGDQFVPGTEGDTAVVSGHFVKNVKPNAGGGGASGVTCDFNDIGECIAILVK